MAATVLWRKTNSSTGDSCDDVESVTLLLKSQFIQLSGCGDQFLTNKNYLQGRDTFLNN